MKTTNNKQQTINLLLALVLIGLLINPSCKRTTQDGVNNESGLKNSEKTEAVLKNAENLRRKMLVKKLMKSEGSTYSIDSGIYYLDVALNIQLADANSYTIEQDNFEKIIELNENQKDFNDIQMAEIFNNAIDYVDSVYNKINNAHKVINCIVS
jgi:hypothetical protein